MIVLYAVGALLLVFALGFHIGSRNCFNELMREGRIRIKIEKCEKVLKEVPKVETWGADGTKFVSVPRAVAKAKSAALKLLKEKEDVSNFIKFCEIELEGELRSAELSWTMITGEQQRWINNEYIRDSLATAIAPEGFSLKWSPNEDLGPDKIFISIIGRKN